MVFKSPFPDLVLEECNVLSYLLPRGQEPSKSPLWLDAKDTRKNVSAADLEQWAGRVGHGLRRMGLGRGDVVMIYSPNHIFVPVAYLSIVGAGCCFSAANPAYTVPEVAHQMENTGAKLILAHPSQLDKALGAAAAISFPRSRIFQFSAAENAERDGIRDWRSFASRVEEGGEAAGRRSWPELSRAEARTTVATINYSSGTTGLPKGVCVSHANLIANVEQVAHMHYGHLPGGATGAAVAAAGGERWLGYLPLYHAFGQLYTVLMAARLGIPVYVLAEFRFGDFLASIERHRITGLQAAPPVLVMLAKRPETAGRDLSSLARCTCGAAPLSRELQNECRRRFGVQINQGWGMTELTCGAIHVPGDVRDDSGAVGQLDPNCEARLVGDDGADVPGPGCPGELYIRGPNVCMGYWRNEQATRDAFDDGGWLKTGDIAVCDDKGFFWIVDRKKELIKVNALQVAPAELEGVLLEHEGVADAGVVGISREGEERPRAYVVLHASSQVRRWAPEEIQEWIRSRVAKHKHLTGGVVFVDEIPKSASGKIQRKILREWAKQDGQAAPGGPVVAKL